MPPKKNPLKLNKLQLRTLALAQVVARDPDVSKKDEATGDVVLLSLPHAHGDHVHVGRFVVTGRDASGFANPAVWTALQRKGLARVQQSSMGVSVYAITPDGLAYDTGFGDMFAEESDH